MIIVESLMDECAYPWGADWYYNEAVRKQGGSVDSSLRLWFVEHAMHGDEEKPANNNRVISYLSCLYQALLDLTKWVENDIEPPSSTQYSLDEGQIHVPEDANQRKGIQPVVHLITQEGKSIVVKKGETVHFEAHVEIPDMTGEITGIEWDFFGDGNYEIGTDLIYQNDTHTEAVCRAKFTYKKEGCLFVAARAVSNRNSEDIYTQIKNLDRVRVTVK